DAERERVCEEYDLLTHSHQGKALFARSARGYLLEGNLNRDQAERLLRELLLDPLAETGRLSELGVSGQAPSNGAVVTVLLKPGVMDPVAMSVVDAAADLGLTVETVRTFRRYYLHAGATRATAAGILVKVLANDAIEQLVPGPLALEHLTVGSPYSF